MFHLAVGRALALAVLAAPSALAQTRETWKLRVDYPQSEVIPRDANVSPDGRVSYFGQRRGGPFWGAYFAGLTRAGQRDWELLLNPPGASYEPVAGAYDAAGSTYALCAYLDNGSWTGALVHVDVDGNLRWSTSFGADRFHVYVAPRGPMRTRGVVHVLLTGFAGTNDLELRHYRFDANGNLLGRTSIPADGFYPWPADLAIDASGAAFVAGWTETTGASDKAALLARVDEHGTLLWRSEIPVSVEAAKPVAATVDPAGRAYVAVEVEPPAQPTTLSHWLVRGYEPDGTLRWSTLVDSGAGEWGRPSRITLDSRGNVLTTGTVSNSVVLAQLDPAGSVLWSAPGADTSVQQTSNVHALFTTPGDDVTIAWRRIVAPIQGQSLVARFDRTGRQKSLELFADTPATYGIASDASGRGHLYLGSFPTGAPFEQDLLFAQRELLVERYCFGDGTAAACPCGNASDARDRAGCVNSLGTAGRLYDVGVAHLGPQSLVLHADGLPNGPVLFFQGSAALASGDGTRFGDGLRCVGGTIRRLGIVHASAGHASLPDPSVTTLPVLGGITGADTRTYQAWYRNAASFCTSSTFNLTNALHVNWVP